MTSKSLGFLAGAAVLLGVAAYFVGNGSRVLAERALAARGHEVFVASSGGIYAEELAKYLKTTEKKIKLIKEAIIKEPVSFTTPIAQDLTLEDYIADNIENSPNQRIEKIDFKKDIKCALDILNERERFIILNRFGLNNRKIKTLEELGNILGFSKERIRQIEMEGLRKLRNSQETQYLKEYLT